MELTSAEGIFIALSKIEDLKKKWDWEECKPHLERLVDEEGNEFT